MCQFCYLCLGLSRSSGVPNKVGMLLGVTVRLRHRGVPAASVQECYLLRLTTTGHSELYTDPSGRATGDPGWELLGQGCLHLLARMVTNCDMLQCPLSPPEYACWEAHEPPSLDLRDAALTECYQFFKLVSV